MIGSYFDLDRAIARIASERETKTREIEAPETRSERIRAYSDFDRSMNDFVRAVGDKDDTRPEPTTNATLPGPASVRGAGGSLGQIR